MDPAPLLAPVPELRGVLRGRRGRGLHRHAREERLRFGRSRTPTRSSDVTTGSSPSTSSTGGLFLVLGSVHMVSEEPAVGRRMAGERRVRRPSRPRSLQHAPDDRRRRDPDCNGALLVRAPADRRTAAGERRPRAGSLLVHRRRPRRLLRRFRRQRDRNRHARARRLGVSGREGEHGRLVPRPGRHGGRRDGDWLLVLRGDRVPHRLPGAARARARSRTATSGSSSPPAPRARPSARSRA